MERPRRRLDVLKITRRAAAAAAIAAASIATAAAADIVPDPSTQAALAGLADASGDADARRRLDDLVERLRRDPGPAVAQLVWYAARNEQDAAARARVGGALRRLDLSRDGLVRALVVHLDDRHAAVRRTARELLTGCEDASAERPPDFSPYRAIIEEDVRAGREPRASLVRHMYAADPGAALRVMVRACQLRDPAEIRPILWAEHVVAELVWKRRFGFVERRAVDAEATRQLDGLSRHERWWVRLYAAEIMRTNPELGPPNMSERLAADPNRLVREAAAKAVGRDAPHVQP